jgi:hypothetical protein
LRNSIVLREQKTPFCTPGAPTQIHVVILDRNSGRIAALTVPLKQ